jgi:hypothetical protein
MEKKVVKVEIGNRNLQLQDQPEPAGLSFEVSCRRNSTSTTTLLCRPLLLCIKGKQCVIP